MRDFGGDYVLYKSTFYLLNYFTCGLFFHCTFSTPTVNVIEFECCLYSWQIVTRRSRPVPAIQRPRCSQCHHRRRVLDQSIHRELWLLCPAPVSL